MNLSRYGPPGSNFVESAEGQQLMKAIQAGSGGGLLSTGGRSIVVEDLETVIKVLTYGMPQFKATLWNILKAKAVPATGIVHEYPTIVGRGRTGFFGPEIANVNTLDAKLKRGYGQVRFMRAIVEWSHVIGMVQKVANHRSIQMTSATLAMMAALEAGFYEGDSSIVPDEGDGLYKLVKATAPQNIINLNGVAPTKPNFIQAAKIINQNMGHVSHSFTSLDQQAYLDNTFEGDKDRIILTQMGGQMVPVAASQIVGQGLMYGAPIAGLRTSFGNIMFHSHLFTGLPKFVYKDELTQAEVATSTLAPATPTFVPTQAADATSALEAGTFRYRVAAENDAGESIAAAAQTIVIAAANTNHVSLAITSGGGANAPTGYRIYRSTPGGAAGTEELIGRIADTAGAATFVDIDQKQAGTDRIYIADLVSPGEMSAMGWAQLSPMGSYELPMNPTSYRELLFLYGVLILYAAGRVVILDNCARQ